MTPTIVLVHGAYAESSSWDDVIVPLAAEGYRVIAWATPLRGLASDAAGLTDLVRSIEGPVVLVGHSYGGALLTNVAADAGDVQALVFVAGFALDPGESCADASARRVGPASRNTSPSIDGARGSLPCTAARCPGSPRDPPKVAAPTRPLLAQRRRDVELPVAPRARDDGSPTAVGRLAAHRDGRPTAAGGPRVA